jgi:hypothetical protein
MTDAPLRQSLKWAAAAVAAQVAVVVLSPFTAVLQARSGGRLGIPAELARTALAEAPWATLAVFLGCLYRERFLAGSARARRVAACAALAFWLLQELGVVFGLLALVFDHSVKFGTTSALILLQYFAWLHSWRFS